MIKTIIRRQTRARRKSSPGTLIVLIFHVNVRTTNVVRAGTNQMTRHSLGA